MNRILVTITSVLVAIGVTASVVGASNVDPVMNALAKARKATAKYQDVRAALKDGYYLPVGGCVSEPGVGAMGFHYLNPALAEDPAIRATKPELLLYIKRPNGKLRLVGVEWFRPDADQDLSTDDDRPFLATVPFQGPMEGHEPGMPVHYDLHAWVWAHNPAGLLSSFNPALSC